MKHAVSLTAGESTITIEDKLKYSSHFVAPSKGEYCWNCQYKNSSKAVKPQHAATETSMALTPKLEFTLVRRY